MKGSYDAFLPALQFHHDFVFAIHPTPNPPNEQIDPPNPGLFKQWRILFHTIDNHGDDIPVTAEPTPFVSPGRILVEVQDVV